MIHFLLMSIVLKGWNHQLVVASARFHGQRVSMSQSCCWRREKWWVNDLKSKAILTFQLVISSWSGTHELHEGNCPQTFSQSLSRKKTLMAWDYKGGSSFTIQSVGPIVVIQSLLALVCLVDCTIKVWCFCTRNHEAQNLTTKHTSESMWYLWWLSQRHIRRNTSIDSTKHNKIGPTGSMPCSAQDGLNLCGSFRVGKFLKIICAVSCRSYCQKVPKTAQVPFVKTPNKKNLSSDWRSSRKQQQKSCGRERYQRRQI